MIRRYRSTAIILTGAVALAIGVLGLACQKDDEPSGGPVHTYVAPAEAGGTCSKCVENECVGVLALCLLDPQCRAMHACANAPGCDEACRAACVCSASATSGSAADAGLGLDPRDIYYATSQCNDLRSCGTACGDDCKASCTNGGPKTGTSVCGGQNLDGGVLPDGAINPDPDSGIDAASLAPTTNRCTACVTSKCNDARKECGFDTECAQMLACMGTCADDACADACKKAHPSGIVAAGDLRNCVALDCQHECGY